VCGGGPSLIGGNAGQHTTPEAHRGLLQLEHSFGQARRYESNVQLTQGEVALVVSQKQAIKPFISRHAGSVRITRAHRIPETSIGIPTPFARPRKPSFQELGLARTPTIIFRTWALKRPILNILQKL